MPNTERLHTVITDPSRHLIDFYSKAYRKRKSDSPKQSRASLLRRSIPHILSLAADKLMLDLGAGRQVFEKQFIQRYGTPKCRVITVDFADISAKKLLMKDEKNVFHIRADGSELPFANESVFLVVSNMALDLMPKKTFVELYRVLESGAHAILNLHHPFLIPDNINELLSNPRMSKSEKSVLVFWDYLKTNDVLFKNLNEIMSAFSSVGFQVQSAKQARDPGPTDKWWEVDLVKK